MQAIKCEVCGSPEIVKQNDFFVCQFCGCKYTPEQVRNLIGVVIDKGNDYQDSFKAGMKALDNEDWRSASGFFKMALDAKPSDAKAFHKFKYCSDMNYLRSGGMTRVKNLAKDFAQEFATVLDMYFEITSQMEKELGIRDAIHDFGKLAMEIGTTVDKKQKENNEYGGDTLELYRSYLELLDNGFEKARVRLLSYLSDPNNELIKAVDKVQIQFHEEFSDWGFERKDTYGMQSPLKLYPTDYVGYSGTYKPSFFRRIIDGIADFFRYFDWDMEYISKAVLIITIPLFLILGVLNIRNGAPFGIILFQFLIPASATFHLVSFIPDGIMDSDYVVILINFALQVCLNHFIIFGSLFALELVWRIIIGIILKITCYCIAHHIID